MPLSQKPYKTLTIFIPEEFIDTLNEFERFLKNDVRIDKKEVKNPKKIFSIGIRNLIQAYVNNQNRRLQSQNESSQVTNQEESQSSN